MVVRGNSLVHGLWIVVKHGLSLSMVTSQVHGLKLPKSSKNNNIERVREREREFGSTFLRIGKNTSWLTSDLGILFFFSFFFFFFLNFSNVFESFAFSDGFFFSFLRRQFPRKSCARSRLL